MWFTYNRNTSIKDRVKSALATVQHNALAINILRSRAESRINFIISSKGKSEHCQSAAYLEEFIAVISNAVLSISEVNVGSEQTVEAAATSLSELEGATSKVSAQLLSELRQGIELELLSDVSIVFSAGNANTAKVMAN